MICLKKLLLLPVFRINSFTLNLIILLFKFLTYIISILQDGSYNRLLPEQFNEKLNCGSWCTRSVDQKNAPLNGLCRFCNINLELKIQQLAQFVPLNKENHDEEVQQYR